MTTPGRGGIITQAPYVKSECVASLGLPIIFRRSSVVEQEAVNFEVAGSSPAAGAKKRRVLLGSFFLVLRLCLNEGPANEVSRSLVRRSEDTHRNFIPSMPQRRRAQPAIQSPEPYKDTRPFGRVFLYGFSEAEVRTIVGVSRGSIIPRRW